MESKVGLHEGKPLVKVDHTRDFVSRDENGEAHIATMRFRAGEYIFPFAYEHPCARTDIHGQSYPALGKTIDVRFIPEKGWFVRIVGALLSPGEKLPIEVDGDLIPFSGWFAESELVDAEKGLVPIRPGASRDSARETDDDYAASVDAVLSPRYAGRDILDTKRYRAKARKRDDGATTVDVED